MFTPVGPADEQPGSGDLSQVQRRTATLSDGTQLTALYNTGTSAATFKGQWGTTPYVYRLPPTAVEIFTERSGGRPGRP
ncbi:hypothetical protein [Streptomyces sp. NBC_01314]|uniref:hypothetical protein n=1 Tax=Streptomyces sp. NBC_01314 TaxID=2903821 RepID=UPI00308C70A7|nr:hypothetical protein OG622_01355 [Streptomyces sp. NBC_01314]